MNAYFGFGMQVVLKPKLAQQDIVLGKLMVAIFNIRFILCGISKVLIRVFY